MFRNSKIIAVLAGSFLISLFFGLNIMANSEDAEVTQIIVGQSYIFSTRAPTRVVISNPAVADVVDVTNTEISVNAKASGKTTLVWWDVYGEQSATIRVIPEDTSEIKRRIDNLLSKLEFPEVYTQTMDEEGKVLILGRVKAPEDRERIATAIATLKDKTIDLVKVMEDEGVVEIDVQVLELNKDGSSTLGFTWPGSMTITEQGSPSIVASDQTQVGNTDVIAGGTPLGSTWGKLFRVADVSRAAFSLKLDLLIQEGKARILSRPKLACQSGKEAELLVGGEKPILTTEAVAVSGAQSTNVDYKEFGIKLKIKPTITEKERVKLALKVEVSDVGEAETLGSVTNITAKAYPLSKRSASTELFINDGETLSIGGLIKQKTEEDLRKFPWLADIPVLGAFFRQRTTKSGGGATNRGDTELFIVMTPRIVNYDKSYNLPAKEQAKPLTGSTPAIVEVDSSSPVSKYASVVQRRILDNLVYPAAARGAGFEGILKLRLHLSYLGELKDVMVKDSSGYKALDDDAVKTAKGISLYPPFPPTISEKELWIEIPVEYRLE